MPERVNGDYNGGSPTETPSLAEAALDAAVERARSGDESAVRHLYRAVQPRLLNYLRAQVGETDAEDVASEAWSRIARDLRSFQGNGNDFRAWAVTIARYRAIDHLRRRRPTIFLAPQDIPQQLARNDTETDAIAALDTASALAMIGELPPDQAQAILLHVVVDLDTPTAARVLGKIPGAIRSALHRGVRNLAKRLHPSADDGTPGPQAPLPLPSLPAPVPGLERGP